MNWDDLRLFLQVCRRRHLDEAGAQLNIDATTISRRIKRLEQELGLTLFERSRRGHSMTPDGERIAALAENIESTAFEIRSLGKSKTSLSGRVRVGAPEGFGATVIAPALSVFRTNNPLVDVDLISLSGFVSVPKRQADMSILLTRPTAGRLKVKKLRKYKLYLYASQKYLESTKPLTKIDDLNQHTLVGYTEDLIYSSKLRYLQDVAPGLSPQLCSPSILAQANMIGAGSGVGILPAFLAERDKRLIRVVPTLEIEREFWLAIHEDIAGLARTRIAVEFLSSLEY